MANNIDTRTPKSKSVDIRKQEFQLLLANAIATHEGLEPFQTPFKITNDEMRKWNTIHGFKINKKVVPSKGREGFLYLQRQEDLMPAIIAQLKSYTTKTKQFGLPDNPTIEDAIRIFDQTGAKGKLEFLQKNNIDTKFKLKELF